MNSRGGAATPWLPTGARSPISSSGTRRTYGSAFDLAAIIPRDVRDWKSYQQTVEKASPATINQRLVALTRFFAWAVKQGLARENPAEDAGSLHLPVREAKGLPEP